MEFTISDWCKWGEWMGISECPRHSLDSWLADLQRNQHIATTIALTMALTMLYTLAIALLFRPREPFPKESGETEKNYRKRNVVCEKLKGLDFASLEKIEEHVGRLELEEGPKVTGTVAGDVVGLGDNITITNAED